MIAAALQKRESELKASEAGSARLAAIVESSDDAIIGKNLNGIITSWNRGAEKIFGHAASDMTGTSIMRLIPADRQDEEKHILGKIRDGESLEHFETVRQTKDGRRLDVSVTVSPIKDAGGRIIGVSKVARDITERRRAEEALRGSQERLRIVTENARVGLPRWSTGSECYTFANAAYAQILGLPSPEIIGRRVADVLAPLYEEQIRPRLDQAFAGKRVSYELRKPAPDGDRFYAVSYEPTRMDGAESLVIVVITDITERKWAEEAKSASEARYRSLFENAPDGIVIADPTGQFIISMPTRASAGCWATPARN